MPDGLPRDRGGPNSSCQQRSQRSFHSEAPRMLEQMRKSSQSLLIYVLFGIVIAVFIINFGPQSRGGSCESTMANDHFAAKVGGELVTKNDFRYGFLVLGGAQYPAQMAKQQRL